MKRKIVIALLLCIMPYTAQALDKKLGATNCGLIVIFDEFGNGISTGLDIVTPFSNLVIKTNCGSPSTTTTVDETGDTIEALGGGYYYICTNDAITNAVEDECMGWVEGEGDHLGLIALAPKGFKAVNDTTSATICDISASTSGVSFTVATCNDEDGNAITLATDMFVGSYMVAYNNGGAQCNVVGHGIFVGDVTSGGVVTVKDSDLPGSGFPATPNTRNCGVRISP